MFANRSLLAVQVCLSLTLNIVILAVSTTSAQTVEPAAEEEVVKEPVPSVPQQPPAETSLDEFCSDQYMNEARACLSHGVASIECNQARNYSSI